MPGGLRGLDLRSIRTLFSAGSLAGLTDGQLLDQFLAGTPEDAEAAFTALMALHGPMVWNVCRTILSDSHNAEDAFQATFLLLVRKASSIRRRGSLGAWLHGVARRVAVRAKSADAQRRLCEGQTLNQKPIYTSAPVESDELSALHEELDRLPERYRAAVVLCHLEGRTHAEAARVLRCPTGTVSVRVSRARELLRQRLVRRRVSLSPEVGLASGPGSAALPDGLAQSTIAVATRSAASKAITTGLVPATIANLADGVIHSMASKKLTFAATLLLAVGIGASGVGMLAIRDASAHPDPAIGGQTRAQRSGAARDERKDEISARQVTSRNLRSIALAMYNAANNNVDSRFTPAVISKDEKPLLSWRVAILPYLNQQALYKEFHVDEAWDSPHNMALLEKIPQDYAPLIPKGDPKGHTYYQVISGEDAFYNGGYMPARRDAFDGPGQTIMVVEAGKAVPWTKPEDVLYVKNKPLPKLGGQFEQGFHALFVDGSVRFLDKKIDDAAVRALITPRGSDVIDWDKLPVIAEPN
jgi:RNA polymerase sigma factor (sigma-70 family)